MKGWALAKLARLGSIVISPLGAIVGTALGQIHVLDREVERFADVQAAGVEQMENEARGIVVNIGNDREQLADFLLGRTMAGAGGLFGAKGIDWPKFQFENAR